jgi:hypothetical protein
MSNQQSNIVSFYFKIAFTHHSRVFEFPLDCTIASLIEIVRGKAFDAFHPFLDRTLFNDVEIVEAGQYNDKVIGWQPEFAPTLQPSSITIREKYEGRYNQTAFYIRPLFPGLVSIGG